MSTPSPCPPSVAEHTYQTSETSDHALLTHSHSCLCPAGDNQKSLVDHQGNPQAPQSKQPSQQQPPDNTPSHVGSVVGHCHAAPPISKAHHHHNVINLSQHAPPPTTTNHTHPINQSVHVHVHAPTVQAVQNQHQAPPSSKVSPTCNCHLQMGQESTPEIHEANIVPSRKFEADDSIEVSPLPPALPPRPPPRPRLDGHGTLTSRPRIRELSGSGGGIRKYVFWCCACGGIATILGALFLAVYFLLRSYTSTLGYFETIPTFVPATMLILTGLCVMSLARRRNRYSYLIKVCGICCLVCALTCVLVTITTTVIHMNRLQTLRECVYTQKTRTCTCYSVLLEAHADTDEGMRFVFDSTPDCEVIHGALYSCLRAMFGLSVSGILVCIFSCMLVYQLLSHERKKMYWEQLELRCRSLYQQHGASVSGQGSMRGPPLNPTPYCSCCEECRYPPVPAAHHMYPWETQHALDRFWTPGRIGNFYSPNPGEEGPSMGGEGRGRERSGTGWNWRRLPWSRGNSAQQNLAEAPRDGSLGPMVSSADSQYGFSNRSGGDSSMMAGTMVDPISGSTGSYSVLDNRPVGGVYVWGPPPPYSNPNSPARRPVHSPARYYHPHHHPHPHTTHCQMNEENQAGAAECHVRSRGRPNFPTKDNYENTTETEVHQSNDNSENTDTSSSTDRVSNTLPSRKTKKRADLSNAMKPSNLPQNPNGHKAGNAQSNNFGNQGEDRPEQSTSEEHSYQEPNLKQTSSGGGSRDNGDGQQCRFLPRLQGVENAAFQNQESGPQKLEPTESEVYFADVSSCCNISVRNDGQDSSLYDEALDTQKPRLMSLQCVHKQTRPGENDAGTANKILQNFQETPNISSSTVTEDEDYLVHQIGKRQMSTRSRLPFPLPSNNDLTLSDLGMESCLQLLPKDISQNSLCSVQTPLTETTDDAVSPMSPGFPPNDCCLNYFPSASDATVTVVKSKNTNVESANQRHRTFSNSSIDQFLAPDAQYEIIQEQTNPSSAFSRHNYALEDGFNPGTNANAAPTFSNLTNTISGLNNFGSQNYPSQSYGNSGNFNLTPSKNVPPKTLNLNVQSPARRGIGSNISTLIQNLGVNPVGLLYGEANSTEDEEAQGQACHSDGTMDSGWQSGSEKQEGKRNDTENGTQRPIDV